MKRRGWFWAAVFPAAVCCSCGNYLNRPVVRSSAKLTDIYLKDSEVYETGNQFHRVKISYDFEDMDPTFEVFIADGTKYELDEATGFLIVTEGWAFAWGNWPRIRADRLSGGADGSKVLAWVDPVTKDQHIFFLGGLTAYAHAHEEPSNEEDWTDTKEHAFLPNYPIATDPPDIQLRSNSISTDVENFLESAERVLKARKIL